MIRFVLFDCWKHNTQSVGYFKVHLQSVKMLRSEYVYPEWWGSGHCDCFFLDKQFCGRLWNILIIEYTRCHIPPLIFKELLYILPYLFLFKEKSSITLQVELKSNFSIPRGHEDPDPEFVVYQFCACFYTLTFMYW